MASVAWIDRYAAYFPGHVAHSHQWWRAGAGSMHPDAILHAFTTARSRLPTPVCFALETSLLLQMRLSI